MLCSNSSWAEHIFSQCNKITYTHSTRNTVKQITSSCMTINCGDEPKQTFECSIEMCLLDHKWGKYLTETIHNIHMEKVVQLNSVTSTCPVITIQSPVCVCSPRAYIQLPELYIKIVTNEVILYQTMVRGIEEYRELVHVATPRGHIHDPHYPLNCQEFPCSAGGTKSYTRHLFPGLVDGNDPALSVML